MKNLVTAVGALFSLLAATTSTHACAVPRGPLYDLVAADAVVLGVLRNFEETMPGRARVTFEITENLRGNVPIGQLSVNWDHRREAKPRTSTDEAIITLRELSSPHGDRYEVMSGCMVQGVYWTAREKKIAMSVLEAQGR